MKNTLFILLVLTGIIPLTISCKPDEKDFITVSPSGKLAMNLMLGEKGELLYTVLLDGMPGEYCAIARKNHGTWYLGIINGTGKDLNLDIPLSRMGLKTYSYDIIMDGKSRDMALSEHIDKSESATLKAHLMPHGGTVCIIHEDSVSSSTGK